MAWIILITAGLFEIAWAIGLKYANGFTRLWPTLWVLGTMAISIGLLGIAMKKLPVGTAYAVWTGVGAIGTVIMGILLFNESVDIGRIISLLLIICGIIGLKFVTH